MRHADRLHGGAASHCDSTPWYPWIFAFDKTKLTQTAVYGSPPLGIPANNVGPGVWQAGTGFVETGPSDFALAFGNGDFDVTSNPPIYGDSVVKFSVGLKVCGAPCPSFMCQAGAIHVLLLLMMSRSWRHVH